MKRFEATIVVEVPDEITAIILNPIQKLTGLMLHKSCIVKGEPETREEIPCSISIEPFVCVDKNFPVANLKQLEPEKSEL